MDIKQQRQLCRNLRRADLVAAGRMRLRRYNADDGDSGEQRRSTSGGIRRQWIR